MFRGTYSRVNTLKSPDYIPRESLGYPIFSYIIDVKPPVIPIGIIIHLFFTFVKLNIMTNCRIY